MLKYLQSWIYTEEKKESKLFKPTAEELLCVKLKRVNKEVVVSKSWFGPVTSRELLNVNLKSIPRPLDVPKTIWEPHHPVLKELLDKIEKKV